MRDLFSIPEEELDNYIESMCDDEFYELHRDIKYLKKLEKAANSIISSINKIKEMYGTDNTCELGHEFLRLVAEAEKLVLKMRTLPIRFGFPYKEHISQIIAEYANVMIEYLDNNILHIKLPALLPKFKTVDTEVNTTLFRNTYQMVFEKYFRDQKYKPYDEAVVVVFYHHYKKGVAPRDHDNMETKALMDVIALYTLPSDNPHWVETYSLSTMTEEESFTEVFVVPEKAYIPFYQNLKKYQK